MDNTHIKEQLYALRDEKYAAFHRALCPGTENIIGVRMPALRAMAKDIARGDWRSFLSRPPGDTYEEILLRGLVIGYAAPVFPELCEYITDYVPYIYNWAVCDGFCSSIRVPAKQAEAMWAFLQPYFDSAEEFPLRFAIVMGRCRFVTDAHIDRLLARLAAFRSPHYYARMAAAWCIADCYVKYRDKTMAFLRSCALDTFTYNKALQKICESLRVSPEEKAVIREMKR